MTYQSGWSLIDAQTEIPIQEWTGDGYGVTADFPNPVPLPNGNRVHCAQANVDYGGYKVVAKFSDEPPPDPGTLPPRLVAAAFNIVISNGDVERIEGAFNLIAALYLDVGQFMLLFLNPQPDIDYIPQIIDGDLTIKVIEKETDYLMVEARDSVGNFADPVQFGISVYRF